MKTSAAVRSLVMFLVLRGPLLGPEPTRLARSSCWSLRNSISLGLSLVITSVFIFSPRLCLAMKGPVSDSNTHSLPVPPSAQRILTAVSSPEVRGLCASAGFTYCCDECAVLQHEMLLRVHVGRRGAPRSLLALNAVPSVVSRPARGRRMQNGSWCTGPTFQRYLLPVV